MAAKVVLCVGDSNTWGADPANLTRFASDVRWTGVLRSKLGAGYQVIEEGLNGRTTNLDDVIEVDRNGRKHLPSLLESHRPLNLITIMLGTNDLKARFNRSASDIAQSAAGLALMAKRSACGADGASPLVLLVAPPPVIEVGGLADMFAGAAEKSQLFARLYAFFAASSGVSFFDAGFVIDSSPIDGIHFDAPEHMKLGTALATAIRRMFD